MRPKDERDAGQRMRAALGSSIWSDTNTLMVMLTDTNMSAIGSMTRVARIWEDVLRDANVDEEAAGLVLERAGHREGHVCIRCVHADVG